MEFWGRFKGFDDYFTNEFNPNCLRPLFEKTHKNGSIHLDYIEELLKNYHPASSIVYVPKKTNGNVVYRLGYKCISVPSKISSFFELSRFLADEKGYTAVKWVIKMFAELEAYLTQHGRKFDYTTFSGQKLDKIRKSHFFRTLT